MKVGTHHRKQGLLAVPFVLNSQLTAAYDGDDAVARMAPIAHRRLAEIMHDVEELIKDHSEFMDSLMLGH